MPTGKQRCPWCGTDPLYVAYHDEEWGVPLRDRRALFELLNLEGAQAGLSWLTILRRRDGYRRAFADFEPERVARFTPAKIDRLLQDPGVVRLRPKLEAVVVNARALLALERAGESFVELLWSFVGGVPKQNDRARLADVPARTPESEAMSRELRRRGFAFVGPTICQALMQAAGLVNDHLVTCHRHGAVARLAEPAKPGKSAGSRGAPRVAGR